MEHWNFEVTLLIEVPTFFFLKKSTTTTKPQTLLRMEFHDKLHTGNDRTLAAAPVSLSQVQESLAFLVSLLIQSFLRGYG